VTPAMGGDQKSNQAHASANVSQAEAEDAPQLSGGPPYVIIPRVASPPRGGNA